MGIRFFAAPAVGLALAIALGVYATPALAYRTLAELEGTDSEIAWSSVPTVGLDLTSFPAPTAEIAAVELEAAVSVWNRSGCSTPLLRVARGQREPEITIRLVEEWAAEGFDTRAAGSTDAVFQSGPHAGTLLVRATVSLNGTLRWYAHGDRIPTRGRDMRAVLVHELGHALGLAHNCEVDSADIPCAAEHDGVAMHPLYDHGTYGRLAEDDIAGICTLYPVGSPSPFACTRADDCMEGEVCTEGRCVEDGRYGQACATRSDCLSSYCITDATSAAGGICTRTCEETGECPSGAECAPLEATDLSVCRPRGGSSSCSVQPVGRHAHTTVGFAVALLLLISRLRPRVQR